MAAIKHMCHGVTSKEKTTSSGNPRNQNGTFRPQNDNQGDPIEQDATRRRPRFNISAEEYQRRMRSNLCLRCAKPVHRATCASDAPNLYIEQRHAEARPTAKKERPGNQEMTTKSNGDQQPKQEKWRSQRKRNRETTKVPRKPWSKGQDQTQAH